MKWPSCFVLEFGSFFDGTASKRERTIRRTRTKINISLNCVCATPNKCKEERERGKFQSVNQNEWLRYSTWLLSKWKIRTKASKSTNSSRVGRKSRRLYEGLERAQCLHEEIVVDWWNVWQNQLLFYPARSHWRKATGTPENAHTASVCVCVSVCV